MIKLYSRFIFLFCNFMTHIAYLMTLVYAGNTDSYAYLATLTYAKYRILEYSCMKSKRNGNIEVSFE